MEKLIAAETDAYKDETVSRQHDLSSQVYEKNLVHQNKGR
jgi:hypothetical protein